MNICKAIVSVVFFVIMSCPFTATAQVQFQYGPRVGLGFSSFSGKDAHNTNFPAGTIVGIYTHTEINQHIGVNAELNYISCGSVFTLKENTPEEMKVKSALGYITLPVNADMAVYKGIHLEAGIQIAYLLSALTQIQYKDTITKATTTSGCNTIDWGPTAGCYYQFNNGLQLGLRYYRGLQSVYKENAVVRNTYLQFLITYKFSKQSSD